MGTLPASVTSRVELTPIEDFMLALLRADFPDMPFVSLTELHPTYPFVMVRRARPIGNWQADTRFTDSALVEIQVFTEDPNGDEDGALISEAIRVALRDAWLDHRRIPGMGSVIQIDLNDEPHRAPDWATASGPVQYADLPAGIWRYESTYHVEIRREIKRPESGTPYPSSALFAPVMPDEG